MINPLPSSRFAPFPLRSDREPRRSIRKSKNATTVKIDVKSPDLARQILDKLALAPFSISELASDLQLKTDPVSREVTSLLRRGLVVKLKTRREGGPFFCLP